MWSAAEIIGGPNISSGSQPSQWATARSPIQPRSLPGRDGPEGSSTLWHRPKAEEALSRYKVRQPSGQAMEWELLRPSQATAAHHHYDLETMRIGLDWVCQANTSFRAAAKCFLALTTVQPPSFWTIRLWVLRLGLYELRRPKERATDWVFILDATIAVGQHKAVVVLGVRLAQMQQQGFNLCHQDVTILEIRIVSRCNGAVVQEALVGASQAVGVPQAVVSDGGSDVKSGVALFTADHPQVVWHYDLSHRLALLLEKELGGQEWWGAFMTQTAQCRQRCQQTAWSHLLPPALRVKARWLGVKPLVNWARKVIDWGRRQRPTDKGFGQLFGWLEDYAKPLEQAAQMLAVVEETSRVIKHRGLNRSTVSQCERKLDRFGLKGLPRKLANMTLAFLWKQAATIPRGQTHLCSSDVLESLFGKYKALVQRSPLHAITEAVLHLAALTSSRSHAVIRQAMESVRAAEVRAWFKENGEPTLLAKRRQAFA
jgi:hypothetical protein